MIKKIFPFDFKKIYIILKAYQWRILAIFLFLLLCLNLFIFYQYAFCTTRTQLELEIEEVVINQEALEKVLANIEEREETLSRVLSTSYPDPFR
jgi:hypothetical protein